MLRAVLVGLLCVSTFGCKGKKDDAAATQSGPAGTVLDVTGSVTVAGKPLAKGATVAADDVVDTGADGHVIIELTHNQAHWDLGPNKHEKVSASLAWTLAKTEGPAKPVDQDTSAAGRPAERSAADTEVTARADKSDEKKEETAPAQKAAAVAPVTGAAAAHAAAAPPAAEPEAPAPTNAPAPPPPPTVQPKADMAAPGGAIAGDTAPPAKTKAAAPQKPSKKVTVPADDYLKCLKGITALHLVLHGHAGGKATYEVTGGVTLPADAKACVDKVTAGIKIEDGAHAEIDVSK